MLLESAGLIAVHMTPLERRLLDMVRRRGPMHGRQLAAALEADSGATARCLVHLEGLGLLESTTLGRTKVYRLRSAATMSLEAVLERIQAFGEPPPLAVLPSPIAGSGDPRVVVVLPGVFLNLRSWLELRRLVRDLPVPVELLIYSEREARRLAHLPGNPVREALKEHPERGARLMD